MYVYMYIYMYMYICLCVSMYMCLYIMYEEGVVVNLKKKKKNVLSAPSVQTETSCLFFIVSNL